jgi:hypothetical protein
MARRYYRDAPQYYDTSEGNAFANFSQGLVDSLERTYLMKQLEAEKEKEEQKKQMQADLEARQKVELEGAQAIPANQFMGPYQQGQEPTQDRYRKTIMAGGMPYREALTPYEQEKMEAELENLRSKSGSKETTEEKERAKASIKAQAELGEMTALTKSAITSLDRALDLNKNSYGGLGGKVIMRTKSATNIGTNDTKFRNTAEIINTMKSQVIKDLKRTFGAQLSDAERDYLDTVYGAIEGMSQIERDVAIKNVKKMFLDKANAARAKKQALTNEQSNQQEITEEDIQETMRLHPEYSRDQILQMISGGQ